MDFKNFNNGYSKAFDLFPNRLKSFQIESQTLTAPKIPNSQHSDTEKLIADFGAVEKEIASSVAKLIEKNK